jgi:transposase
MEILHPRRAGLDVHKKTVAACLRLVDKKGKVHKEIRQFDTMTQDLLQLSDWLSSQGVTHVAMESSGVYWKPIYNLLEDDFQLLLVNAAHAKNVPGRKTDVQDAEWIADLLAHGLLIASYVPDRDRRELRELVRYRKSLIQQRSA